MYKVYVALENLRSVYNVGAIIRTCAFFGIPKIYLVGVSGKDYFGSGKPYINPKVYKTSLGGETLLDLELVATTADLISLAQKDKCALVAVEQHPTAININQWQVPCDTILVFGNEVTGVSRELITNAKAVIEIVGQGKKSSLNVEAACASVLTSILS